MAYTITPLTVHTAAEVRGLDLTKPVDAETRAALNRAFAKHHVLVVRDQKYEPPDFLAAVQVWGALQPHDKKEMHVPGYPQMYYVSNEQTVPGKRYISGETFHTDHSNHPAPPKATILYPVSLPSRGGDTQYVNMHLAYDGLPEETRRRIDRLKAIHVYQSRHSERKLMALGETDRAHVPDAVVHPIVRTHPESRRKAIYINPIRTEGIVGMAEEEALALLAELLEHSTQPKYQYRHQWRPGDLVMWDNRSLLHKANGDYDMSQVRYLYRVMLQGDTPV